MRLQTLRWGHKRRMNQHNLGIDFELEQDVMTFWVLVFEIISDMEKRLFSYLAEHTLTPPQFYVLRTLVSHGGRRRIGQIAQEHHLTNATMTGLVKRLEALDPPLVMRQADLHDKRAVDVILTDEGEARFWAVSQALMAQARQVLGLLPATERREVIDKTRHYFRLLSEQFPVNPSITAPVSHANE
jgi:DNA-binding MarR family transcriptional regulator